MEKFFYYNDLYAVYKNLLTSKEQEIFSAYYEENLSMGEIAENRNISRSAVGKTIKIVEKKLDHLEEVLKVVWKNEQLKKIGESLTDEKLKRKLEEVWK